MRRVGLSWLRILPGGALVVDVACGAGGFLAELSARFPESRCFAADLSGDALALARGRRFPLLQASAAELPIRAKTADAVVLHDVLQHLPPEEERAALAEARRVLKPGGLLSVRTNFAPGEASSPDRFRGYDRKTLRRVVSDAGFRVVRHRVLHPIAARLGRRRREAGRCERHTPGHGGELNVRWPGNFTNSVLDLYCRLEDLLVTWVPFPLPSGDAQLLLARKPESSKEPGER